MSSVNCGDGRGLCVPRLLNPDDPHTGLDTLRDRARQPRDSPHRLAAKSGDEYLGASAAVCRGWLRMRIDKNVRPGAPTGLLTIPDIIDVLKSIPNGPLRFGDLPGQVRRQFLRSLLK